jgi:ATP-binding cassette subfamily F protein uup
LVFEGPGRIEGYAGGYDDWLIQRPAPAASRHLKNRERVRAGKATSPAGKRAQKNSDTWKSRELEALPGRIESLEARQQELFQTLSAPDFYRQDGEHIARRKK